MRAELRPSIRAKIYRILKALPLLLLLIHLGVRWGFSTRDSGLDLWLFNLVAFFAAVSAGLSAPLLGAAIGLWCLGNTAATTNYLYGWPSSDTLINWLYLFFYPVVILAIVTKVNWPERFKRFRFVSAGLAALTLVLFLPFPRLPQLTSLDRWSAKADIFLMLVSLILIRRGQQIWLVAGLAIFATYDFIFLIQLNDGGYKFAQLADNLWLLGLVAMAHWATLKAPLILPGESIRLAYVDELTGLPNRRALMKALPKDRDEATLLLMDLDGFKKVNDNFGHEEGDQVLMAMARRFTNALSHEAMLARLGGDEFGVIIPGDDLTGDEVAQALAATTTYPVRIGENLHFIGVSIGKVHNDGGGQLLARADLAMYEAKRAGENIAAWHR